MMSLIPLDRFKFYGKRGKGYRQQSYTFNKILKSFHILAATAWAGGAISIQTLTIFRLINQDLSQKEIITSCALFIDMWVVMPGLFGCILTGLVYSIFSSLGFFKYSWIAYKWIISICAGFWGLFFMVGGDKLLLAAWGSAWLEYLLQFVRGFILPETIFQCVLQLAVIFSMLLISVSRPINWEWLFFWRKASHPTPSDQGLN